MRSLGLGLLWPSRLSLPMSAAPLLPGLYGHSAVYHEATDSLYVFGGFRFHVELAAPSPELYSLHCPDRTWSLLAPSQGAKVRVTRPPLGGRGWVETLPQNVEGQDEVAEVAGSAHGSPPGR